MSPVDAIESNARIWTTYLSAEWDGWLHGTRFDSTEAAHRTASYVSAVLAPWLVLITSSPLPPSAPQLRNSRHL